LLQPSAALGGGAEPLAPEPGDLQLQAFDLERETLAVPGKIGALVLQILRENTDTDVNVESASNKGTRVTINFVPQALLRKPN
jgi:hypothetical protein